MSQREFSPTREGVGLKSGALLVREWNGRLERVMILDDGCAWNGCVYRSLSQVAKAITGTNWNGHRFFGLKAVRTGASNRKRNVTPRPDSASVCVETDLAELAYGGRGGTVMARRWPIS